MSPGDVASLRVHFFDVEGVVSGYRVRPHRVEHVFLYGFEVDNPYTWVAVHEIGVGLVAMWGLAVDVEGLCLDSIGEIGGFCLVW